ncbi:hypothetical protein GCM10008018_21260 [Paenibacillus marchantiophytorum]|uniref:HTH deoR-type domain-containing protein n=1 Tax=Paenibacillus marchantiophytorum TaxID=1619310 RepID=A0ABQ1EK73_9BACL|nr:DeoR family transcriptional regulator [Paenibacillus marchantiophytorum]GFZ75785.1 hypothetical protein GCM10008018_21260 [Paenibacillus marchantiophytorum]
MFLPTLGSPEWQIYKATHEMALRRDLEKLGLAGLLSRTFGGAILIGNDTPG